MPATRRNLGVWDSKFQQVNKATLIQDATRMIVNEGIKRDVQDAAYVGDKLTSIANIERQLGKPMSPLKYKQIIEKAAPQIKLDKHPLFELYSVFEIRNLPVSMGSYGLSGGAQRIYIGSVGGRTMKMLPEWSVMSQVTKKVPSLDRKDPIGQTVTVPDQMEARGWRSMLALLVSGRHITKTAADKIVLKHGSEARPSWQATTGESNRRDYLG